MNGSMTTNAGIPQVLLTCRTESVDPGMILLDKQDQGFGL